MPVTDEQDAGNMKDVAVKNIKDPVTTEWDPQASECGHDQLSANGNALRI